MMRFAVFPILLLILLIGVIVTLVIMVQRKRGRVSHPSCGQCGYAVAGLEVLRCPECGGDLRVVGIVTPSMQRGVPRVIWVIVWSVLLILPAMVLTSVVDQALPRSYFQRYDLSLGSPISGAYSEATIILNGIGSNPSPPYTDAEIVFVRNDGAPTETLNLDLPNLSLRSSSQSRLTKDWLTDWMAEQGIDTSNPSVSLEADQILQNLRGIRPGVGFQMGRSFRTLAGGSTGGNQPRTWFAPTAAAFWFVIWVLGVLMIWKRRDAGSV